MKKYSVILKLTACLFGSLYTLPSSAIQKCQDADGNWHYGDVSVGVCDNSKVTTLDNRGFIKDEVAAPKTEEEILAEKVMQEKKDAELLRIKQEQDEKLRILSIYETEADIDRQRDNQISSVDGNIVVHEGYLKNMASRIERMKLDKSKVTSEKRKARFQAEIDSANARVEKSTDELAQLRIQKQSILDKFKKEKELYIALKNQN